MSRNISSKTNNPVGRSRRISALTLLSSFVRSFMTLFKAGTEVLAEGYWKNDKSIKLQNQLIDETVPNAFRDNKELKNR